MKKFEKIYILRLVNGEDVKILDVAPDKETAYERLDSHVFKMTNGEFHRFDIVSLYDGKTWVNAIRVFNKESLDYYRFEIIEGLFREL